MRRWRDSNPHASSSPTYLFSRQASSAILSTPPSDAQQQYRWLSASLRLGKMTATLNGRMANVVGYFVPLHSLTTLATHMYIFEFCLRPTSGSGGYGNRTHLTTSVQHWIVTLVSSALSLHDVVEKEGLEPSNIACKAISLAS